MNALTPELFQWYVDKVRISFENGKTADQIKPTVIEMLDKTHKITLYSKAFEDIVAAATKTNGHATKEDMNAVAAVEPDVVEAVAAPTPNFREIALAALARGENRIVPIKVGGKAPCIKWAANEANIAAGVDTRIDSYSTEQWAAVAAGWVDVLAANFPSMNGAVIAKPNEVLFLDEDFSKEFRAAYEAWSGEKFPNTYATSARENRLQSHWRQTDATRKLGNVVQGATANGWISVRQRNEYVLAEGSQYKDGVNVYKSVGGPTILPFPDKLVEFIQSIRLDRVPTGDFVKKAEGWLDEPFIHGNIDNQVASFIGHYIKTKNISDPEELYLLIENKIETNGCFCEDGVTPYAWDRKRVEKMCHEKPKTWKTEEQLTAEGRGKLAMSTPSEGVAASSGTSTTADGTAYQGQTLHSVPSWAPDIAGAEYITVNGQKFRVERHAVNEQQEDAIRELKESPTIPYPKFPHWVMDGTSLFEGYTKPYCKVNSRIDYFMWMPAVTTLMNYLGTKVRVKNKNVKMGTYIVLVGKKGQTKKSSCMQEAIDYLNFIGLVSHAAPVLADGRSFVFTAGSAEGLGLEMQKRNCKNAILLYDELSILDSKAGIESSSLGSNLLLWYEAQKFANTVKNSKEAYSHEPGKYCISLLAGCTLARFPETWARLAKGHEGMDDRFTVLLQPTEMPEKCPQTVINNAMNAVQTKALVDAAVAKGEYEFEPQALTMLKDSMTWMSDRDEIRAEKYALYFAIDLGFDTIDIECVQRGIALVKYEREVKAYLRLSDAQTKEGQIQLSIISLLERADGYRMLKRDLYKKARAHEYGTSLWGQSYMGLIKSGRIREEGTGKRNDPAYIQLLTKVDYDDE